MVKAQVLMHIGETVKKCFIFSCSTVDSMHSILQLYTYLTFLALTQGIFVSFCHMKITENRRNKQYSS